MDSKPSALAIELYSSTAIAQKELSSSSWCIASLYIYLFSTVLTSHTRSTVLLLDTRTPGTSGEIYKEDANGRLELATPGLQTQCSSD